MVLDNFNLFFIVIFTSELLMKIFALRHHYFKDAWNLFDFVVVMMSLLSLFFSELIEKYFVSPTLLRVVSYKTIVFCKHIINLSGFITDIFCS
jgi:voltage-gated sodium channel type II alpha